jgi:hypothetical protein
MGAHHFVLLNEVATVAVREKNEVAGHAGDKLIFADHSQHTNTSALGIRMELRARGCVPHVQTVEPIAASYNFAAKRD